MLKNLSTIGNLRWLFLGLALLLGGQVLEAGHLHDSGYDHPECLQCQSDAGQAAAVPAASTLLCPARYNEAHPDIAAAPVATFYRLAARGPPRFFS